MNTRNPKDFLGFIKFVDDQYIHDFFNLGSLWLSNYRCFIGNKHTSEEDLINDEFEGKLYKLQTDMPAFFTCFTLIEKNSFDEHGILKDNISSALIDSEKCMNKNRNFVYIPKENMKLLIYNRLNNMRALIMPKKINKINESPNYVDIFTKFINYPKNYKHYMERKEQKLFTEFCNKSNNHKAIKKIEKIEKIGWDMFCTKPDRFEVQNELRIGIVFPFKEEDSQITNQNGIPISFNTITFATKKFSQSSLKNLNIIDLQNLNKENLNKEKKNEEGFKK